jgi:hypothetical protein
MTCRLRRRKAALTTYKPQHISSDPYTLREKSEGEASEAEKKGRRQSRRLLDTKRIEEMSETSQSCDNAVSIQLACTAIAPLQTQVRVVKPKGWTKGQQRYHNVNILVFHVWRLTCLLYLLCQMNQRGRLAVVP